MHLHHVLKLITDDLKVEAKFENVKQIRPRKKKRLSDYDSCNQSITDPETQFKVSFFFSILDQSCMSLDERFQKLKSYNDTFGFLHEYQSEQNDLHENF